MSNIPNKTKPEPMSAERLGDIRQWFGGGSPGETSRLFGNELLAEVDRLSTALVAANADIVTARSYEAAQQKRADEAERKLAVAMEALGKVKARAHNFEAFEIATDALAAITSDAPAVADTKPPVYCPPCDTPFTDSDKPHHPSCPASKPLVVGQRYAVGVLPVGAVVRQDTGYHLTLADKDHRRVTYTDGGWDGVDADYILVSLPSAKADEGNLTCSDVGCECHVTRDCGVRQTDPDPPALTREEVVNIWLTMMRAYDRHNGGFEDSLEAARLVALSDGGGL